MEVEGGLDVREQKKMKRIADWGPLASRELILFFILVETGAGGEGKSFLFL